MVEVLGGLRWHLKVVKVVEQLARGFDVSHGLMREFHRFSVIEHSLRWCLLHENVLLVHEPHLLLRLIFDVTILLFSIKLTDG